MLLGMGKGGISKILLIETLLIGAFSLAIGLLIGKYSNKFICKYASLIGIILLILLGLYHIL